MLLINASESGTRVLEVGRAEEYDVIEARLGPFEVYVRYADCADLVLRCADSEVLWNESIRDDFGPIENY